MSQSRMLLLAVAILAAGASAALAARPPTLRERQAIVNALPRSIRRTPVECLWLDIRVSRNARYALVGGTYLNASARHSRCLRYARNSFLILKRAPRWKIVYEGSVDPPCFLHVPRDLIGCREPQTVVEVHDSQASIASFETANEPTLAGAVRTLGVPSACRTIPGLVSFASANWRRLGLRMVFGTYGTLPRKGPCAASNHVRFDSAYLTGHSWRTRGLRVGDSVATLRRRYPRAVRKRYRPGVRPISGWWLVVQVSRVPDLHRFPALLATTSHGRVTGFVVTFGLEGD